MFFESVDWPRMRGRVVLATLSLAGVYMLLHRHADSVATAAALNAASLVALVATLANVLDSHQISESVSTQYIGQFPHNMPQILKLVRDARKDLTIIADHIAYGVFSAPAECDEYGIAIADAIRRKVSVRIYVYDLRKFDEVASRQLEKMAHNFEAFTEGEAFAAFERAHSRRAASMRLSPQGFFDGLRALEVAKRADAVNRGIVVREVHAHIPTYMWIADGHSGVFCHVVDSKEEDALEFAFQTRDGHLVRALTSQARGFARFSDQYASRAADGPQAD